MKPIKLKDIKGKDSHELELDIQELKKESFELTFRSTGEDVANPARRRQIRRTIARIKTVLRERQIEAQKAQKAAAKTAQG